ncbi:MAG: hypothetical protein A2V70_09595 [Planctomycetes bacterium RBG_13_63_9]|nr:MAG: hypothetical protein A2V70_09595 [Planctomycetes bacterium RBG_13_63_9]
MEHAVDPVADPQSGLLRFDVHVAGPRLDRLQEDLVDQPDDRGFLGELRKLGAVTLDLFEQLDPAVERLGQETLDRLATHAEVRLDQFVDLRAPGQDRHDRQSRGHAEFVQRIEVERVARGNDQGAVVLADGEERFSVDELLRESLEQGEVDLRVG